MSKTNELVKLIKRLLIKYGLVVFYDEADEEVPYPYIVFSLTNYDSLTYPRDDIELLIDIWDKGESSYRVEEISDQIEKDFKILNKPTDKILPTFYSVYNKRITDEDKEIKRRQVKITIQCYEVEEE